APALLGYVTATLAVILAAAIARLASPGLGSANIMLLLLVPVLLSAVRFGFGPAALAAAEAVISYNFFFVWPQFSFKAPDSLRDVTTLGRFLRTAGLTSRLAGRARDRELAASDRGRIAEALLRFSHDIAAAVRPGEVMQVIVAKSDEILDARTVFLVPHQSEERLEVAVAPGHAPARGGRGSTPLSPPHQPRLCARAHPFPPHPPP